MKIIKKHISVLLALLMILSSMACLGSVSFAAGKEYKSTFTFKSDEYMYYDEHLTLTVAIFNSTMTGWHMKNTPEGESQMMKELQNLLL